MKPQFNKTWLIISAVIIINIFIFSFMSNKLESYVAGTLMDKNTIDVNF